MGTEGFTDFYGNPLKHKMETPGPGYRQTRNLDGELPCEGWATGMMLRAFEADADPYILYNRFGQIVKQWPEDYTPDREEIRQAVYDELRKEGRHCG